MASSLSNFVVNLAKGHDNGKCKTRGIRCQDCECCLEYTNSKGDLIECKYVVTRITKKSLMKEAIR